MYLCIAKWHAIAAGGKLLKMVNSIIAKYTFLSFKSDFPTL